MTDEIKLVLFGIGPIGERIAKVVLGKKGMKIVGAVEIAKEKAGRDLGDVIKVGRKLGVIVTDDPDSLFAKITADVALIATGSYVRTVYSQVVKCIESGMNVVSTCEQLAYPWLTEPQLAKQIDELAKRRGVTVLSTGINPGWFNDTFPIVLTGICREVKRIEASRAITTGLRRSSFQKKIGTGMSPEEFREKTERGEVTGHVGFRESVALTAAALGWELDKIEELPPEPVIAEKEVKTMYTTVKPGQMLGYIDVARGIIDGREVINYKLIMHAGVEKGYEEYNIEGTPNIRVKMSEFLGDWETAHVVVNMIPKVINAKPGLMTMKDLPAPCALLGDVRMFLEQENP